MLNVALASMARDYVPTLLDLRRTVSFDLMPDRQWSSSCRNWQEAEHVS